MFVKHCLPVKAVEIFQKGKLTGENWKLTFIKHGTRTIYPGKQNKGLSSTFQPPEESWSVQWLKRCDKHGDKDEDKNVINVQKYKVDIKLDNILMKTLSFIWAVPMEIQLSFKFAISYLDT